MENIEAEVTRLAHMWLEWFQKSHTPPAVVRIDFMISHSKGEPTFQIHTCELTECGGATCGLKVTPRTVAILNDAMGEGEGFPKPLPPFEIEERRNEKASAGPAGKKPARQGILPDLQAPMQERSRRLEMGVAICAILGLVWPRFKLGKSLQSRSLSQILAFSVLMAYGMWKAREKIRDTWMRASC